MTSNTVGSTDDFSIEVPAHEDWEDIYQVFSAGINIDGDPQSLEAERELFEPERSLVVRSDGRIVATLGGNTRQIAVPGAVIPAAHGCRGAVSATVRRQGILTQLMRRHFEDARALGEAITLCWASEGRIYHRFGYGVAVRRLALNVNSREVTPPPGTPAGRVTEGSPADLRDALVKIYDQVYAERPGWSERTAAHWDYRLADLMSQRAGGSALRAVIHEGDDGIDGYALWRVRSSWSGTGPLSTVDVVEQVSTTPEAYDALWRFLLKVDLTRYVSTWSVSVDEPLFYWVGEARQLSAHLCDGLYIRVVDVAKALASRRYATAIDVVIDVTDDFLPVNTGKWRLTGSPDSASCAPTTDDADLAFDIRALGAVYMGGASLQALAGAGLIRELRPGALAEAAPAFGWHQPPSAFEIF
ncbi:GNAT family N-acetyltransferase [Planotetraspora sp. A-T 1434]|uniref:GNAT family N-acetyltransferase n=1 Tax=Planotetraspora sp. A-T 1434 TaxID=2979219 RepID=UPI0021C12C92|nr:GNAT family N-acetyltransferase [Planotetraspora sp. A-T 1434]MCT9935409.1 GNAT family N-acetyltransferase [Planotetraspora sp. A-T 1434]